MAARVPLGQILTAPQTLFVSQQARLPTSLIYSNEADFNPRWAAELAEGPYHERIAHFDAIEFGRLPAGVMLRGEYHHLLCWEGSVVNESIPHALRDDPASLDAALAKPLSVAEVDDECVIIARYGHGTWGHWIGEILPMAVAVESAFPGRFLYAIPQSGSETYVTPMLQSLAAYGIRIERLAWLRANRAHRFQGAWAVTPVWSDHAPHPAVLDMLRTAAPALTALAPNRLALMRRDWSTRTIVNADEVQTFLSAAGFHVIDMAGLSFTEQVRVFRSAEIVFSVLGSGLTGLVYSPDGVKVIAASPSGWSDRFFYALTQLRGGRWAEIKGSTTWAGDGMLRDAPFEIPIPALRAAIAHL